MFHFWKIDQILNILKEKMIVIANVFSTLQTVKNFVRTLSKKRCFRTRFDRRHVKAPQIPPKSAWERLLDVVSSFSRKLIWKMSPQVLGVILGVFVKILTADTKYPAAANLTLSMQLQLSEKRKCFSEFFVPFLESTWSFKRSEIKDDRHS